MNLKDVDQICASSSMGNVEATPVQAVHSTETHEQPNSAMTSEHSVTSEYLSMSRGRSLEPVTPKQSPPK